MLNLVPRLQTPKDAMSHAEKHFEVQVEGNPRADGWLTTSIDPVVQAYGRNLDEAMWNHAAASSATLGLRDDDILSIQVKVTRWFPTQIAVPEVELAELTVEPSLAQIGGGWDARATSHAGIQSFGKTLDHAMANLATTARSVLDNIAVFTFTATRRYPARIANHATFPQPRKDDS